jgi:hypothetical protein
MDLLFRKQTKVSLAQVLEDARQITNEEMKKPKYKNYRGPDVFVKIKVKVQPDDSPPVEAELKASILETFLLLPGVVVRVKYDPRHPEDVELDDEPQTILDRNPQLKKQPDE